MEHPVALVNLITHSCFFKLIFYWSIVELQCCVNFHRTAKSISYTYTYIYSSHPCFDSSSLPISFPYSFVISIPRPRAINTFPNNYSWLSLRLCFFNPQETSDFIFSLKIWVFTLEYLIHLYSMELLLYLELYRFNICTTWFGGYLFQDFIFYKAVLCSQQNGEEGTCIPHILPAPAHA